MKSFLIVLVSIFLIIYGLSSCDQINKIKDPKKSEAIDTVLYSTPTSIQWRDTLIDLGDVKAGKNIELVYAYQNVGKNPLMLFHVSPGCGCTIADYSSKPLMPAQKDSIVAKFDSKNKEGKYLKTIKVTANTAERIHTLAFRVNVLK